MARRMSITEAGTDLEAVIKRVSLNQDSVVLEKNGLPVAGLLDIDAFEDYLELQDPEVRQQIQRSNEDFLAGRNRMSMSFAAELRREMRARTNGRRRARARRDRDVAPHYEQQARKLLKAHADFRAVQVRAFEILDADPLGRTGTHRIKQLTGIPAGAGQWRLSLGRFRFRYDIYSLMLVMQYCGLRPVAREKD